MAGIAHCEGGEPSGDRALVAKIAGLRAGRHVIGRLADHSADTGMARGAGSGGDPRVIECRAGEADEALVAGFA